MQSRPWDSLHTLQMEQWEIFSEDADKDSGYEAETSHIPAHRRRGRRGNSLTVDTGEPFYPPGFRHKPPAINKMANGFPYDHQYFYRSKDDTMSEQDYGNQMRFSSLQRPARKYRKPPDSILKNSSSGSYNSLPRGYTLRNSVKFASPVDSNPRSFDSDQLDFMAVNKNVYENYMSDRENFLQDPTRITGSDNQVMVGGLPASDLAASQPSNFVSLTPATTFPLAQSGNAISSMADDSGTKTMNGNCNGTNSNYKKIPVGGKKCYSDSEHYLRKSASVQIIAHEPSRCEGCFDGRLPLLLIVIFIALVLFLLCLGVVIDIEGISTEEKPSTTAKEISFVVDNSTPCQKTICTFGATCYVDKEGSQECKCMMQCPKTIRPVCGSDGVTYDNDCQRQLAQCKLKKPIKTVQTGPCTRDPCLNLQCPENQMCLPSFDLASARCVCKGPCQEPLGNETVCGSDGASYQSLCILHKESCQQQKNVSKIYEGPCDPCANFNCPNEQICLTNSERQPYCTCISECPQMIQLVCASNGKSYRNQCTMKQDSCRLGVELLTLHTGLCGVSDTCSPLHCIRGAECVINTTGTPLCQCMDCPPVYSPVCGTDNVTHHSECHLRRRACETSQHITIQHWGECGVQCTARHCPPHGMCKINPVAGKPHSCQCPDCGYEWNPVCGNSKIYDNICQLEREACLTDVHIMDMPKELCEDSSRFTVPTSTTSTTTRPPTTTTPSPTIPTTTSPATTTTTSPPFTTRLSMGRFPLNQIGDCSSNPCLGGGTCDDHDGTFSCFCPEHRTGQFCGKRIQDSEQKIPYFSHNSYIEFRTMRQLEHKLTIELEMKVTRKTGTVLYTQQGEDAMGDYMAVVLLDGYVEFRYNLGDGPVNIRSLLPISMGEWHKIVAKRWHQDGVLKVDDGPEVRGRSDGFLKSLDLSSSTYLGFIPLTNHQTLVNTGSKDGIQGCVRKLKINSRNFLLGEEESMFLMWEKVRDCGSSHCAGLECYNQGKCIERHEGPACECPEGFSGTNCQISDIKGNSECDQDPLLPWCGVCEGECSVPDFTGDSYLVLPLESQSNLAREVSMEIWLLTRALDGVILYSGGSESSGIGDFLSLTLVKGYVQFQYDLGSGIANITSRRQITLNTWHNIKINRGDSAGYLQVNDEPRVSGFSPPPMVELNLGDTLFVGGIRNLFHHISEAKGAFGLDGAIQRIIINKKLVTNLVKLSKESHRVREYSGVPCSSNRCQNGGTCVLHFRTAVCRCRGRYAGKYCEIIKH